MKLVLVNYEYPPLGGGAGNATACIARALVRQGHDIVVLTSGFGDLPSDEIEANGPRLIRLRTRRHRVDRSNYLEMFSFVAAAARFLPPFLRQEKAHGLIVFFSLPCGPLGLLAHARTGIPYVVSLRGGDVPGADPRVGIMHRVLKPLRRATLRKAKAVVANSFGLAQLSERADPVRVEVIANGIDTDYFSPAPGRKPGDDVVRFLFAGRFQSQKNLRMLLDQFAQANKSSCTAMHLTLVGDGPERVALQDHAAAVGIAESLDWPGWLDKERLREAYRGSDVFLNPSLYEGMPNTVLEAMACGLPVVASDVIGNNELIASGETGVLFDLACPADLGKAILDLANQPERRRIFGARAREIARSRYAWENTAARYASLLENVEKLRACRP